MNAALPPEQDAVSLVELIDFKWLMTAQGLAINVERLKREPAYAQEVLDAADASGNEVLRRIAAQLRARLGAIQAP